MFISTYELSQSQNTVRGSKFGLGGGGRSAAVSPALILGLASLRLHSW